MQRRLFWAELLRQSLSRNGHRFRTTSILTARSFCCSDFLIGQKPSGEGCSSYKEALKILNHHVLENNVCVAGGATAHTIFSKLRRLFAILMWMLLSFRLYLKKMDLCISECSMYLPCLKVAQGTKQASTTSYYLSILDAEQLSATVPLSGAARHRRPGQFQQTSLNYGCFDSDLTLKPLCLSHR